MNTLYAFAKILDDEIPAFRTGIFLYTSPIKQTYQKIKRGDSFIISSVFLYLQLFIAASPLKTIKVSFLILFLLLGHYLLYSQEFCLKWNTLQDTINARHYSPKAVDNNMSKNVFDLVIKAIDKKGSHLLQTDYDIFKRDRLKLDDYLKTSNCTFVNTYIETFNKRIRESENILKNLRTAQLDYDSRDSISFSRDNEVTFFKTVKEKKRYWKKLIKYRTISKYLSENEEEMHQPKLFQKEESHYRVQVIESAICQLNEVTSLKGGVAQQIKNIILEAQSKYQDPHSTYFDKQDKTSFDIDLSTSQLSTGVETFKNKEGVIEVANITLGSVAFKNKKIAKNDIINAVIINDKEIDLTCFSNQELQKQLQDPSVSEITYIITKDDGLQQKITLTKAPVAVEENNLTGFVINAGVRVGFISIPSFYRNNESPNGLGMTNDLARELYKLKKMNIDALILDVRDNGGGSMQEAIDLSGLFIDRGPVAILKDQGGHIRTLKDFNRGSVFDKPLAILVNEYSASASEFFVGAMQDYNRALIIGVPTYGKSTAQLVLPLNEDKEKADYIKLTTEVFYRATGKSHQAQGVIPDILLPSLYKDIARSESQRSFALKNDTTEVKLRLPALPRLPVTQIKSLSNNRVKENELFTKITKDNSELSEFINKEDRISVTLTAVKRYQEMRTSLWEKFNASRDQNTSLIIENTGTTAAINGIDPSAQKANKRLINDLGTDPYIIEASQILKDVLQSK